LPANGLIAIFQGMSRAFINIVVTCTARKTARVPSALMMRRVRRDRLDRRFDAWSGRVGGKDLARTRAVDLYCGNSWSVIRDTIADQSLRKQLRIWIISAGHGLVPLEEPLSPYAATFSSRDPDSVIPPELSFHSVAEWWELLVRNRRKNGASVASIADIARIHPRDPLIVAASSGYLRAVALDLEASRAALDDGDRLVIIAAGARKIGPLIENYLPCDSRLEHRYGRSRMALNSRILRSVVCDFPVGDIRASRLSSHFRRILARLPKAGYPERRPSEDKTVCNFIRRRLAKDPSAGYTTLLRLFRGSGRACEQKRFRELFRGVVGREKTIECA
jgi:hypothetical protein